MKHNVLKEYIEECNHFGLSYIPSINRGTRYDDVKVCQDLNSLLKDHFQEQGAIELLIEDYKRKVSILKNEITTELLAKNEFKHSRLVVNYHNYKTFISELENILKP